MILWVYYKPLNCALHWDVSHMLLWIVWYVSYTSINLLYKNFKLNSRKKTLLGNGQRTWTVISLKRMYRWQIWRSGEKRCSLLLCLCLVAHWVQLFVTPDCSLPGSSVHGTSQARILESVAISSSRGIFLTQRSNPCLQHCRQIPYPLSHQGSPIASH